MVKNNLKPKKKTLRRIVVWFNQKCQLSSGRKSWWLCCVSQCAQCALCNVHNVHPESWATIRDLIQFHSSTSSSNNQKFNCEQITRTKDLIQYHTISTSFSNNQVRKYSSKLSNNNQRLYSIPFFNIFKQSEMNLQNLSDIFVIMSHAFSHQMLCGHSFQFWIKHSSPWYDILS